MEPDLVQRELESLRSVLARPLTRESLDSWMEDSALRREILAGTLWGSIYWRKSMGRPLAPTLSMAFVVEHVSWQSVLEFVNGGYRFVELLVPHPEPSKQDGVDDDQYHRVNFVTQAVQGHNRVRVDFAPRIGWQHGIQLPITERGYRDIDPPLQDFNKGESGYVLEPFEVVMRRI